MVIKHVTAKGRDFARTGLDISRFALESSAKRLLATAERLNAWSTKLAPIDKTAEPGGHDVETAPDSASEPAAQASSDSTASDKNDADIESGSPEMLDEVPESLTGHEETVDMS